MAGDEDGAGDSARPYHHGALRKALLEAAEQILQSDGGDGLTLRAAARAVGTSHTAPRNHFGDLSGLLSELAAVGFERFCACLKAAAEQHQNDLLRLNAIGRAYVEFALANPALFQLMFRSERLDLERPALKGAMDRAQAILIEAVAAAHPSSSPGTLEGDRQTGAYTVRAWSMVHGFAMLLLDTRLGPVLAVSPDGDDPMAVLETMLRLG